MQKTEYVFGGHVFSSKTAAETHVKKILQSAPLNEPLNQENFQCVFDLLKCHPDARRKIGRGVAAIRVALESRWKSRHFEILRVDGSETDFSYKNCLTPPTKLNLFKKACRHAVADQVIDYRNFVFDTVGAENLRCPILGVVLSREITHVDHVPPITFEHLVQTFIAENGIDVSSVRIAGFNDNEMKKSFLDDELTRKWQLFHKRHAKLRLVSREANLSHIKRGVTYG